MIGQVLVDRYEICEQLGKKSGRQTWLAYDRQTEKQVVVKVLSFNQEFVWDDLKLFEREAETLRSLSHPAIPHYLDFFEVKQSHTHCFALVQSYVAGRSLDACLKAGRTFSEPDIKQLATSLLEILSYLHSRQPAVIHRDIKPSNIVLIDRTENSSGEVYLVDFGSVQTLAATEGGTITIVGSYGYMPPEQYGGRTSPASDLYGLGATLIYLATGRHPADIPQKQLRLQFAPLTRLSPDFTRWLARMVEPGLDERFASAEVALRQLNSRSSTQKLAIEIPAGGVGGTIAKPSNSKVELIKSSDALTIYFPQVEVKPSRQRRWFSQEILLWFAASLTLSLLSPTGAILLMLLWSCGWFWEIITLSLSRRQFATLNMLKIDQQQITLQLREKDRFILPRSSPRKTLIGLEYQCREDGYCTLTLLADRSYQLKSNEPFTTADLGWLAHELSQWLELPLKQPMQYPFLPDKLLQNGALQMLDMQAAIVKPSDSQIVLMKKPGWIEILIPTNTNPHGSTHSRLYIDHQQIHQTLPSGEDLTPSMRQAITALEYRNGNGYRCLRVWAGQRKYELGEDGFLSPEELQWLAYELSEWLGLPVYATNE